MTFLSHPACFSGFIQDFLEQYAALLMQKAVSACFGLHGSRPMIKSNVGSMMFMSGILHSLLE